MAETAVGQQFPPHGFLYLVESMGGDHSIVQAARVSRGPGTKTVREDGQLIDYLMAHEHMTPFEMVELKFHVKAPLFVARQWMRHRAASINEISGRYSEMPAEHYIPTTFMTQDTKNKQGSAAPLAANDQQWARARLRDAQGDAHRGYRELLALGVSREQARLTLPLSLYTEWYWKVNLRNCFHFLGLRLDRHAQAEIREYADAVARIAQSIAPVAYAAFEEHRLFGVRLSRTELAVLRSYVHGTEELHSGRAWRHLQEKVGILDGQSPAPAPGADFPP